jgi:lysophospholipase L1-like esterase
MRKSILVFWAMSLMCFTYLQPERVTIYMVGDSTMQTYKDLNNPIRGWGQEFQSFFDTTAVLVENHAMGGRSSRSFMEEGRWKRVLEKLKKGDYVFIQFGHNDASKNKPERYTSVEDFKKYLTQYVTETREKEAFPVLLTQTGRRDFDKEGHFDAKNNPYVEATKEVAAANNVPLIDMNMESVKVISGMGSEAAKKLFMCFAPGENPLFPEGKEDNTHMKEAGATMMAGIAAKGIQDLNLGLKPGLKKREQVGNL